MSRKTLVLLPACLIPALALPLGAQTTGDSLKYTVPEPPAASYQISQTSSSTTTDGTVVSSMETSATLSATFEKGPSGLIVTISLEGLVMEHSGPTRSGTSEPLETGEFVLVVDSRGSVDFVSTPNLPDSMTAWTISTMLHGMFPRLPEDAVRPGDTWVDTTSWEREFGWLEVASTSAYTYTLVGDAVVDGRTLTEIRISGVTKARAATDTAMGSIVETSESSDTGFLLWDSQRNMIHSIAMEGNSTGTVSLPMGEFSTVGSQTSLYWTKN